MATTISRPTITDDTGTPSSPNEDGTLFDAAFWTDIFNRIDNMWSGATQVFDGVLSVGGFGTNLFSSSGTGHNILRLRHTTAGTGNAASLEVGNNADADLGRIQAYSSTYTETGGIKQNGISVRAMGAGGLSLLAEHASGELRMYAGGTSQLGTFDGDRLTFSGGTPGTYALNGVLADAINTTQTGTDANTTEKDLHTYALPAGTLATNGQMVRFTAGGTFGNNANTKTIRGYFGATAVVSESHTWNNRDWFLSFVVVRTGATSQKAIGHGPDNQSDVVTKGYYAAPAETLSGSVTLKITGENGTASANDVVCEFSYAEIVG